jgi:CDP-diacylglycerol--glycerol-3-phosphate 3-phosphatidyltransferase
VTAANIITIVRILLTPVFMVAALSGFPYGKTLALAIFIVASITDGIDGYIARRYNQITTLGKFLDPLADKLLVTAAILVFVQKGLMSCVSAMIIITREFVVTSLRIVAMGEGVVVSARLSGKIKTVVQIISITLLLTPLGGYSLFGTRYTVGNAAVLIMVIVTVISGIEYFRGLGRLLGLRQK